jgi:hypothetical protein
VAAIEPLNVGSEDYLIPGTEALDLHHLYRAVAVEGRPICCEMWPGNTADVKTLLPIVKRMRERFRLREITVVADRGMVSQSYLTATRGLGSPDAEICYERAEALCHSLNRPMLLHSALMGQWRYSLMTDKLNATMQIAERVYSLAQEQNYSALIGACSAFATTLYFLGDFETARQYAMRGIQIWRSGSVQSPIEELDAPAVLCLCYEAVLEWHAGEITSCHATMAEAISLAKELRDMHALAEALCWAADISYCERDPAEVERYVSDCIELSTRYSFAHWRAVGAISRVGRAALPVIPLLASHRLKTASGTGWKPAQCGSCHSGYR